MNDQKKEKSRMSIVARIFMILGIIFTIIILLLAIVVLIKPYGVDVVKVVPALLNENPKSSSSNPYLTSKQAAVLESIGVNPNTLPTKITPSQQKCATAILGETRVKEIVSGATPSVIEVLKVKDCLNK
jgi:hypothetical protein